MMSKKVGSSAVQDDCTYTVGRKNYDTSFEILKDAISEAKMCNVEKWRRLRGLAKIRTTGKGSRQFFIFQIVMCHSSLSLLVDHKALKSV